MMRGGGVKEATIEKVREIGIEEARAKLGELVDQVARGSTVILTRRGRPVAQLVPVSAPRRAKRSRA